nr:hypothetical protein [Tanacetum cinerariifolium]
MEVVVTGGSVDEDKAYESSGNIATKLIKPCTFGTQTLQDGVNKILPLMGKLALLKSELLIWRDVVSHQCEVFKKLRISENLGSLFRCFDPSSGPKLSDMGNVYSGFNS